MNSEPFMTCTCGAQTPLSAMPRHLPTDHFECGQCRTLLIRRHARPTVYPSGFVLPGKVSVERVEFGLLGDVA
ncbi:hypothetical protein [Methylomagnum ishizawai]|uniref:hypothetical protein n=1 Tax=Methylomagnum ishizawai TaxID=1760988 RepID=UPI001C31F037|nr:hypothetical protein [Methylomagnum ishizawai]BBL73167.1 hypothetical protein MishRS11D_02650 [Methylomagnum ishizawai]